MLNEESHFLQQDEVLSLLNVSPNTLESLKNDYMILAVQQNHGEVIYPKFQFILNGLNLELATIISCFKKVNANGWDILQWFLTDNNYIDNISPLAYYLETQDVQTLRTIASISCDLATMV